MFNTVKSFCESNDIDVPSKDDHIGVKGKSIRRKHQVTLLHYYRIDIFSVALDAIMAEMDHRFNEVSSELLVCMSCLDPSNSFLRLMCKS